MDMENAIKIMNMAKIERDLRLIGGLLAVDDDILDIKFESIVGGVTVSCDIYIDIQSHHYVFSLNDGVVVTKNIAKLTPAELSAMFDRLINAVNLKLGGVGVKMIHDYK